MYICHLVGLTFCSPSKISFITKKHKFLICFLFWLLLVLSTFTYTFCTFIFHFLLFPLTIKTWLGVKSLGFFFFFKKKTFNTASVFSILFVIFSILITVVWSTFPHSLTTNQLLQSIETTVTKVFNHTFLAESHSHLTWVIRCF